jgi:hypothetical protein
VFYFISFLKGHAKIIDEYLSDSRASFHGTVVQDKIRFHDNNDPDPDWMVKQCHLLIIAGATEIFSGVSNLGHLEGDKHIQALASMYRRINLKPFAQQHHFAGVTKSVGTRIPEIYLTFFYFS